MDREKESITNTTLFTPKNPGKTQEFEAVSVSESGMQGGADSKRIVWKSAEVRVPGFFSYVA